ncbi:TonB-dependent receptor, partial [Paraburkholderia sp. SIMBA_049]
AANPARSAETDTATDGTTNNAATASPANSNTLDVEVNAKRLDEARNGLLPETGSSIYRITQSDIQSMPQGANTPLNQVLLQAPGVAND